MSKRLITTKTVRETHVVSLYLEDNKYYVITYTNALPTTHLVTTCAVEAKKKFKEVHKDLLFKGYGTVPEDMLNK